MSDKEKVKAGLIGILISFIITYLICWMYEYPFGLNFKTIVIFMILDAMSSRLILYREIEILKGEE